MSPQVWETIGHIAVATSTLVCFGSAVFMVIMRSTFASKEDLTKTKEEVARDLGKLGERMTVVERVASPEWLSKLGERLSSVEGDIKEINATLTLMRENQDHQRESLDSIQAYLLEHER